MSLAPVPASDDYFTSLRAFLLTVLPSGIEVVQQQDNRVPPPAGLDFVTMNEVARRRLSANVTTYADCAFTGSVTGSLLTITTVRLGTVLAGATLLGAGVTAGTTIGAQQSGTPGGAGVYGLSQVQQSPISGVPLASGAALIRQPTEIRVQVDVYGPASADNTATVTTLLRDGYAAMWFSRTGWADRGVNVIEVEDARQMPFIDGEAQYETRFTFDVLLQADQVVSPAQDFADSVAVQIMPADAGGAGQANASLPALLLGQSVTVSGGAGSNSPPAFSGFGYQQYVASSSSSAISLSPGVRTPLTMVIDPAQTTDTLKPPFSGFTFWDGALLHARAVGDVYEVRVTMTATSAVAGGTLTMDVTIVGLTVATDLDSEALSYPAGQPQRVGFKLRLLPKTSFVAGGAQVYVTSTVPVMLTSEVLVVDPSNAGP